MPGQANVNFVTAFFVTLLNMWLNWLHLWVSLPVNDFRWYPRPICVRLSHQKYDILLYVNFVTCFVISSGWQRNTIFQYLVELLCFFLNYSIKIASKHIFGNKIFDFMLTWLQFCNIQILFIFRLWAYTKLNYQF